MSELTECKSLRRVYTNMYEFVWLASEGMANHMKFSVLAKPWALSIVTNFKIEFINIFFTVMF